MWVVVVVVCGQTPIQLLHFSLRWSLQSLVNIFILAVNCSTPPERPGGGTWEWDGGHSYGSVVTYTCGLYGNFQNNNGTNYEGGTVKDSMKKLFYALEATKVKSA